MNRIGCSVASLLGLLVGAADAGAQHPAPQAPPAAGTVTWARTLAEQAQRLDEAGSREEARALLGEAVDACEGGGSGNLCRQVLHFNRGYLAQRVESGAPDRDVQLRAAAVDYLAVLGNAPQHAATLANLAYVHARLGPGGLTPRLIDAAVAVDPGRAASYLVLLGDHHRLAGRFAQARDAYRQALSRSPDEATPLYRLISLHREEAVPNANELWRLLDEAAERFPRAAAQGYAALAATLRGSAPNQAEAVLVRWLAMRARTGEIGPASLTELPADWRPQAVVELETYIRDPWSPPDPSGWWLANPGRSDVLAAAALAIGEQMVLDGRPAAAEACWRVAAAYAPAGGDQAIDLIRQLASLYYRNPALDVSGEKLRELEERLFDGKGDAISSQDLELMQRFHSVLGLLYAERGVWRSDRPWTNAVFQLERALETARRREERENLFQPLATLKELLAQAYLATDDQTRAGQAWVHAARAFLDSDDLDGTARMLDRAGGLGIGVEAGLTRGIFELRRRLASPDAEREVRRACQQRNLERIFAARDAPLDRLRHLESDPAAFLDRQCFKILADCAGWVDGDLARRYADAALALTGEPDTTTGYGAAALDRATRAASHFGRSGRTPIALLSGADAIRVDALRRVRAALAEGQI